MKQIITIDEANSLQNQIYTLDIAKLSCKTISEYFYQGERGVYRQKTKNISSKFLWGLNTIFRIELL